MINSSKITKKPNPTQIAGLLSCDSDSEFIGVMDTMKVLWVYKEKIHQWYDLPKWVYQLCQKKFLSDQVAMDQLGKMNVSIDRQIELFIYHSYGAVDSKADIINGVLQQSENFRHSLDCPSLCWDTKNMTIDGVPLTKREVFLIDSYKADLPDKMIAHQLKISQSTLDYHKRNLTLKLNAQSKMDVLVKALNENI